MARRASRSPREKHRSTAGRAVRPQLPSAPLGPHQPQWVASLRGLRPGPMHQLPDWGHLREGGRDHPELPQLSGRSPVQDHASCGAGAAGQARGEAGRRLARAAFAMLADSRVLRFPGRVLRRRRGARAAAAVVRGVPGPSAESLPAGDGSFTSGGRGQEPSPCAGHIRWSGLKGPTAGTLPALGARPGIGGRFGPPGPG